MQKKKKKRESESEGKRKRKRKRRRKRKRKRRCLLAFRLILHKEMENMIFFFFFIPYFWNIIRCLLQCFFFSFHCLLRLLWKQLVELLEFSHALSGRCLIKSRQKQMRERVICNLPRSLVLFISHFSLLLCFWWYTLVISLVICRILWEKETRQCPYF